MKDYPFAVFIARLQPPHRAHIQVIERALDKADQVIIVLGSSRCAANIRNPWTANDRAEMVKRCFDYETCKRLNFVSVRDQPYSDTHWMVEVHTKVTEIAGGSKTAIMGHMKDNTSFYLEFFPQWDFVDLGLLSEGLNATQVRNAFFEEGKEPPKGWADKHWHGAVHPGVKDFLEEFRETEAFTNLLEQWTYVKDYKAQWDGAPFPPTFVTTDAVVVKSGHVLVVERGYNPGKGLFALPGGFVDQDRSMLDCALRELKEETRIKVDKRVLRQHVKSDRVFADPHRSTRGRTITNAFYIKLPDGGTLPEVRGKSDAKRAFWMPLGDIHLNEEKFFEDHIDIIEAFTTT